MAALSIKEVEETGGYRELTDKLWKALMEKDHCDVTINVSGSSFPCHRLILCTMSPYFEVMFTSGMKESQQNVIEVKGLTPAAFEIVLSYMYKGKADLNTKNIQSVLHASAMLLTDCLTKHCEMFLTYNFRMDQWWLPQWKTARKYSLEKLQKKVEDFIDANFIRIGETRMFAEVSTEELCAIVSGPNIRVKDESDVLKNVLIWLKTQQSFTGDVSQILSHVAINQIPKKTYKQSVEPLLKSLGKDMVKRIQDIKMEQQATNKTVTRYRSLEQVSSAVAGIVKRNRSRVIIVYCLDSDILIELPPLPVANDIAPIPCIHNGNIMCGRGGNLFRFNPQSRSWMKCHSILDHPIMHLFSQENELYAVVFRNGLELRKYNEDKNGWQWMGFLSGEQWNISTAFVNNKVYVMGTDGNPNNTESDFLMRAFDLETYSTIDFGHFYPILSTGVPTDITIASRDDKVLFLTIQGEFGRFDDSLGPVCRGHMQGLREAGACFLYSNKLELMVVNHVDSSKTVFYDLDYDEMTVTFLSEVPHIIGFISLGKIKNCDLEQCSKPVVKASKVTTV